MIYHELQARQLYRLHALNTVLQGPFFSEGGLLKIAADLEAREQEVMSAAGTMDAEDYLADGEGSHNISNSGYFNVEEKLSPPRSSSLSASLTALYS
ncbi:hypothetical protein ZWY2020_058982 [Hordeum vulgare]|nr:hypothetical protein ZWY2020_058982 [Hordeum vulgare]